MARSFKRNPQLSAIAEPNVTPLIDLAFSLLIIFMITTPLLEQTIPLDLPTQPGAPASAPPEQRQEAITITGPRAYYFQGETVSYEQLDSALGRLAAQMEPPILHIRAEGGLSYQEVVTLLDLLSKNNLSKISLDTSIGQ